MRLLTPQSPGGFVAYADAPGDVPTPIDMHAVMKTGNLPAGISNKSAVAQSMLDADKWLPFAAEAYNISPRMSDMIVVPTTIFLTDLPNANMAAFPFNEVSAWNSGAGTVAYRTWKGKPTHLEHANSDPTKAKGVIFDSSLHAVSNYIGGLHRVVLLAGWDRDRDPDLARTIAAGRSGFSMGAYVQDYSCSVCAASMRNGGCAHIHPKMGIRMPRVGDKLVYKQAHGVTGFEVSSVKIPAFRSAIGRPIG
jgi:hypothetical protein